MVVSKSYFCPRILSQPGMREWIIDARESHDSPLSAKMRELVNDLPNYVGSQFDATIFDQHPEMRGAVDTVVDNVLNNGDGDLVVRFNELSWRARLFNENARSAWGETAPAGIRLHLRSMPVVTDATSLNDFFRAVLATDPRYQGDPSRIAPNDTLKYDIITPHERRSITIADLVADWSHGAGKMSSRPGTLVDILQFAGIDREAVKTFRSRWSLARLSHDARYFTSPLKRCRYPGIDFHYRLSEGIADEHRDPFTLSISHHGCIIVDGSQLEGLDDRTRSLVTRSAALWRFAYHASRNALTASRFMLSLAHYEGDLEELISIFILHFPHLFVRFITPVEQNYARRLQRQNKPSWDQAVVQYFARTFEGRTLLSNVWSMGTVSTAMSDAVRRREMVHRLVGAVMPACLQQEINASYADIRAQLMRMVLRGESRERLWEYADAALEDKADEVEQLLNRVRVRYTSVLETSNLWNDAMSDMLYASLEDAIEIAWSVFATSLHEIITKTGEETGLWHAAYKRGPAQMMRSSRIALWRELRRFIDDEKLFSSLRSELMSSALGWIPLGELPSDHRDFMLVVRERVLDLYGGKLPERVRHGRTVAYGSPLRTLVEHSELHLNDAYTPSVFLRDVEDVLDLSLLQNVMTPEGPVDVGAAYRKFIEPRLGWRDIAEAPAHVQPLLSFMRERVMRTLGGRVPNEHPLTKANLRHSPLPRFIVNGSVVIGRTLTLHRFREALLTVASLRRDAQGLRREDVPRAFNKAFRIFVEGHQRWASLDNAPPGNRELLALLRDHIVEHFGGRLLSKHPITGANLRIAPVERFIREGQLRLSHKFRPQELYQVLESIFGLKRHGDGYVEAGSLPKGFDQVFARVMTSAQGWAPLTMIPASVRSVVALLRRRAASVFWGTVPRTLPGRREQIFPPSFEKFVRDGTIAFNGSFTIADFRRCLKRFLTFRRVGEVFLENGALPSNFDDLYVDCVAHAYGWSDIRGTPQPRKQLVRMFRSKMLEYFDGNIPYTNPVTGVRIRNKTLANFIQSGDVDFGNTSEADFNRMLSAVLRLRKIDDGYTIDEHDSPSFTYAYQMYVRSKYGWVSIREMPQGRRPVVIMLRRVLSRHFRWRLPETNPVTGMDYSQSPLGKLAATGQVKLNASLPSSKLQRDIRDLVSLERKGDAFHVSDEKIREFEEAFPDFIASILNWSSLDEIDSHRRPLIEKVRAHVIEVFGGCYPKKHPFTGLDLGHSNVAVFVAKGAMPQDGWYSRECLRGNLVAALTIGRDENGALVEQKLPEWFDGDYSAYFEHDNDWTPLDEVPPHARPFVGLMREHMRQFFLSALPHYDPLTGRRLDQVQVFPLINGGTYLFSGPYGPREMRDDMISLYNVKRDSDQKLRRARRSLTKFDNAYQQLVAHEYGWRPLDEVDRNLRELLRVTRWELVKTFGGRFPRKNPLTGTSLNKNALRHFVFQGEVKLNFKYRIDAFLRDLELHLLGLVRTKKGYQVRALRPYMRAHMESLRAIYKDIK